MSDFDPKLISAAEDFRRARRRADLEQILGAVSGKSVGLLPYDEVRRRLRATEKGGRSLREIPLDAIVGSVDRYTDFTRNFLPRRDSVRHRWVRVRAAMEGLAGLPPIEVYQVGEAYFVQDGHHRVSVAAELGAPMIQAYVTEVHTKASLSPGNDLEQAILKAEEAAFFEQTGLDRIHPELDMHLTVPGGYGQLLEHIQVHRYFMGLEQKREISIEQAAGHWYEHVYLPVVETIRVRGVLRDFPGRTEADLYLWISEHREALKDELQMDVRTDDAVVDLTERFGSRLQRVVNRLRRRVVGALTPDELEAGPAPGYWRRDRLEARGELPLFAEILAPLGGEPAAWRALDQAQVVAQREGATIYGLRVTQSESDGDDLEVMRAAFLQKCGLAGVEGTFLVDQGEVARRICERSRWTDLVVVSLSYPPGETPLGRLGSGFRTILRRCPRPVLAVPELATDMRSCLLAYDGSPKAEEALYLAAYLAGRWSCPLTVVTVEQPELEAQVVQARGRSYLERRDIPAEYLIVEGDPADRLLEICAERGVEVMIMGGYGAAPVVEVVLGSTVDRILRAAQVPLLICR